MGLPLTLVLLAVASAGAYFLLKDAGSAVEREVSMALMLAGMGVFLAALLWGVAQIAKATSSNKGGG